MNDDFGDSFREELLDLLARLEASFLALEAADNDAAHVMESVLELKGAQTELDVLLLPERSVPLLQPAHLFGAHPTREADKDVIAVVVHTPVGLVALHVDEVFSQEAVMLKPLQRSLRVGREGVLGATVRSDGSVALVLDVARLTALGRHEHAARPLMLTNHDARG